MTAPVPAFQIVVERQVGTEQWIVVKRFRYGWSVLFRGTHAQAHKVAGELAHELNEIAWGR